MDILNINKIFVNDKIKIVNYIMEISLFIIKMSKT